VNTRPMARRRWLALSLGAAGLAVVAGVVVAAGWRSTPAEAAAPATPDPAADDVQPFDHTIHVGQYGMACLSCHVDADKSTTAGLPSLRKCMGCHKFVDKEKPGVVHLAALWEAKQAPRWPRVYNLPDFVYFPHRVHVAAGVECTSCHGQVGEMHQVTEQQPLTMGWCLGCHSQRKVEVDCLGCHK